jgi:hypothetical protein
MIKVSRSHVGTHLRRPYTDGRVSRWDTGAGGFHSGLRSFCQDLNCSIVMTD